jgi:hypothetical protein
MIALTAQVHCWFPIILGNSRLTILSLSFNLEFPPFRFFEALANSYVGYVGFGHFIPADKRYLARAVIEWLPTPPDLELQWGKEVFTLVDIEIKSMRTTRSTR